MTPGIVNLKEIIDAAAGRREADLYLEGGELINVFTGEIYPANIAVYRDKIVYVGESRKMIGLNIKVIDASGFYLSPAYIEPHYHPWLVCNPVCLAEAALCRGITTMVCDNLFFFVTLGAQGFLKLARSLDNLPVRFLWLSRVLHQAPDPTEDKIFSLVGIDRQIV